MPSRARIVLAACSLLVIACVRPFGGRSSDREVWASPDLADGKPRRYVFLPFDTDVPGPSPVVPIQKRFESVLRARGNPIIGPERLERLLREKTLPRRALEGNEVLGIGRDLEADAVVTGLVSDRQVSLKAVDVKTGEVLWRTRAPYNSPVGYGAGPRAGEQAEQTAAGLAKELQGLLPQVGEPIEMPEPKFLQKP